MKMKRYEEIEPSNRTTFRMLYYNAGRTLTQIETILKRTYGNPLPIKSQDRLFRIRHKLEQMVARYKQCETELKNERQARKSNESKNA